MRILFGDLDASGLGPDSWPLDVGLVGVDGAGFECASKLVRPGP
jgi:hypothetical protein